MVCDTPVDLFTLLAVARVCKFLHAISGANRLWSQHLHLLESKKELLLEKHAHTMTDGQELKHEMVEQVSSWHHAKGSELECRRSSGGGLPL